MIILGVLLLILGIVLGIGLLTTIGILLLVIGAVLWVLGSVGHPVAGRPGDRGDAPAGAGGERAAAHHAGAQLPDRDMLA